MRLLAIASALRTELGWTNRESLLVYENSDVKRIGVDKNPLFLSHEKTRTPFCFCFAIVDCKCASSLRKELSKRSEDAGMGEAHV